MSQLNQPGSLSLSLELLTKSSQVTPHLPLALRDPAMLQPQVKFARASRQRRRSGMTLIELLVAVSILVIIAAILVPQLRFASADRNIREASRVVASLFAQASQRGINDGEAGVVIERNPNILDEVTGHAYAGTSMFMLRQVPRYIGEDETDEAELVRVDSVDVPKEPETVSGRNPVSRENFIDIFITMPLEQEELGIVRVGDQISFNDQGSVRFVITKTDFSVAEQRDVVDNQQKLRLRISSASDFLNDSLPNPPVSEDPIAAGKSRKLIGSFIVYRQPRKLISSRLDMPKGYLVDLRLSGEVNPDDADSGMLFDQDDRSVVTDPTAPPNSITYLFNSRGSIDRFFYTALVNGSNERLFRRPTGSAFLMVREYSTDDGGESIENVLANDRSMWVTVDPTNGTANVVSGVAVDLSTYANPEEALNDARTLSSQGQQAAQ